MAAYTGLRAAELVSLTAESFTADGVLVRPSVTKNRERLCQPIPRELQKMLKPFLKRRVGPLWPGKWFQRAAEMIRVDLEAAKIPYATDAGVFDFHALRATYVTSLVSSGRQPKDRSDLGPVTLNNHVDHAPSIPNSSSKEVRQRPA